MNSRTNSGIRPGRAGRRRAGLGRVAGLQAFALAGQWLWLGAALAATPFYLQTVETSGDVGNYTSLEIDAAGNPHVSYYDGTSDDLKYAHRSGVSWTIETVDTGGAANVGAYTSLALDAAGNPHVSYYDVTNQDLKYASKSGASWTVETVETGGNVGQYTSLALDAAGNPHVSYYDATNLDLKYAQKVGGSWTIEVVDGGSGTAAGLYNSLALTAAGNPRISYYYATTADLRYASKSGATWTIETVDAGGFVGQHTSLALDGSGNPRISYRDVTNLDLKYAAKSGATWTIETVDSAGDVGWHTSLALDGAGVPHVSYQDLTNFDLKYANKALGAWTIELVDAQASVNVGWYTSIEIDICGRSAISYRDGTNSSLKLAGACPLFEPMVGFEDDVDLVTAPNGEFVVVPEESKDGSAAFATIIDLDAASGLPLAVRQRILVPGFENAVDPLIKSMEDGNQLVMLPVESEDGLAAELMLLLVDNQGAAAGDKTIELGDLGFRPDTDGTWAVQPGLGSVAFFPLESEDGSVRGVLAVDVSNGDGDWGSCNLRTTDGRAGCAAFAAVGWLPGLVDGADPIGYPVTANCGGGPATLARFALPVSSGDLLYIDYQSDNIPGDLPPTFCQVQSVKTLNAAALPFPGWERDVDLAYLAGGGCGPASPSLLVPVEGPGGGDLYLVDAVTGLAAWRFQTVNGTAIPGFEIGVDLLLLCALPGYVPPNRVVMAVENAGGTDADLWIANTATGALIATAEGANPGLTIPGFEIGVDLTRWTTTRFAAGVEGPGGGSPGVLLFDPGALLTDSQSVLGFKRSVDPIVKPAPHRALIVPVSNESTDGDVLVFFDSVDPPDLDPFYSVETVNPGIAPLQFEWDVDLGLVDRAAPGGQLIEVPEEEPSGATARLRFEPTVLGSVSEPHLAIASEGGGGPPSSFVLVQVAGGVALLARNDLEGLETGLDLASGAGPIMPGESGSLPGFPAPTGMDRDEDPTLGWLVSPAGVLPEDAGTVVVPRRPLLSHRNPFAPPDRIRYVLPARDVVRLEIVDVAGRPVRHLFLGDQAAGEHAIVWDGADDRGIRVARGVYFLEVRGVRGAAARGKLAVVP